MSARVSCTGSELVRENSIRTLTIGGALSGNIAGGGNAFQLAAARAISINSINKVVVSEIADGTHVTTAGSIEVSASDGSKIHADAGGVGLALEIVNKGGTSATDINLTVGMRSQSIRLLAMSAPRSATPRCWLDRT